MSVWPSLLSLQIDRSYSCTWRDCTGQNETLYTLIFHTGRLHTCSLTQHTHLKITVLQIWCVCVWNFGWSWWEVHISDSRWDLEYVKLLGQPIDGERRALDCPSNSSVDAEPSFFHASGSNIQNPKKTKQKHHLHPKHEMGVTGGEREKKKWQKSDLPFWEVNSCRKKILSDGDTIVTKPSFLKTNGQ